MKNVLITALLLILIGLPGSTFAQAKSEAGSPEVVVKNFYAWYIGVLNKNATPFKQRAKIKQFVSARLIAEIDRMMKRGEYDADYFINAQDWDNAWAKNIKVSDVAVNKGKANAAVFLDGESDFDNKLKLSLVREQGSWKIDTVESQY
jgi:hypothetical protein